MPPQESKGIEGGRSDGAYRSLIGAEQLTLIQSFPISNPYEAELLNWDLVFPRGMLLGGTLVAFAVLGLPACSSPAERIRVIAGATSVDPPIPRSVILIKGDRILAVGPEQTIKIPPVSERFNAAGRWIVSENRGERLEAGHSANLLLLSGDPRQHPSNYHRVERTMREGRWIEGPTH